MKGMTEFIKEHSSILEEDRFDKEFLSYHLRQIGFLQHERLVHLMVLLFIAFCMLAFMTLFLVLNMILLLIVFLLLLIMTFFYVFHYYKLENTVIEWYFIYNERINRDSDGS